MKPKKIQIANKENMQETKKNQMKLTSLLPVLKLLFVLTIEPTPSNDKIKRDRAVQRLVVRLFTQTESFPLGRKLIGKLDQNFTSLFSWSMRAGFFSSCVPLFTLFFVVCFMFMFTTKFVFFLNFKLCKFCLLILVISKNSQIL